MELAAKNYTDAGMWYGLYAKLSDRLVDYRLDQYDLGGYWSSPGFLCGDYGQWPGSKPNERCIGIFYFGHYEMPELPRPRGNWEDKITWVTG